MENRQEKLDDIKERLANTSEGDWDYQWCMYEGQVHPRGLTFIKKSNTDENNTEPTTSPYDAHFFLHAKSDIQWLLQDIEQLQKSVKDYKNPY